MRALYVERRPLVDALLAERPWCEAGIPGLCTGRSTDVHELLSRGRSGSITDVPNLLCLCRRCHEHVTGEPSWAERHGLALSTGQVVQVDTDCRDTACGIDHRLP